LCALGVAPAPVARGAPAEGGAAGGGSPADEGSMLAPPDPRGTSRLEVSARPFFSLFGSGWGAISDATFEWYPSVAPLRLSATVSPLALAVEPQHTGMITHLRLGVGYASRFVAVGMGAGTRVQRLGPGGYSLSADLRLGALDGLNLQTELVYAVVRNYYTGAREVAFGGARMAAEVPISHRLALVAEGGFSFDAWVFATVGLKHHLGPRGVPGTWSVRGGLGLAWVLDHFPCQYADPRPCENAAWATGPTVTVGIERRF
jgi:hypothetical protein